MRRARLRRSGWQAVLPWTALAAARRRRLRYVVVRGSDSEPCACSTAATSAALRRTEKRLRRLCCFALVSYTASLGIVAQSERSSFTRLKPEGRNVIHLWPTAAARNSSFFGPTAHAIYRHTLQLFVALTSSLLIYHKYTAVAASFPATLEQLQ